MQRVGVNGVAVCYATCLCCSVRVEIPEDIVFIVCLFCDMLHVIMYSNNMLHVIMYSIYWQYMEYKCFTNNVMFSFLW